ncbi:unnamed protein product [Rhizophagus irregularis]|nr:unnamed protein product [Rhizophagus irregularis]
MEKKLHRIRVHLKKNQHAKLENDRNWTKKELPTKRILRRTFTLNDDHESDLSFSDAPLKCPATFTDEEVKTTGTAIPIMSTERIKSSVQEQISSPLSSRPGFKDLVSNKQLKPYATDIVLITHSFWIHQTRIGETLIRLARIVKRLLREEITRDKAAIRNIIERVPRTTLKSSVGEVELCTTYVDPILCTLSWIQIAEFFCDG